MSQIQVDKKTYEVDPKQNLLEACLGHGLDLPYFCWHPALGSVGACRQCAVKVYRDEKDTQGRIQMACMTPIAPHMIVSINDPEVRQFRAGVIEGLMMSHPHDCPVCDEGGECHLQDMTVMSGHNYRRYSFPKRTFQNQYLGPLINHEMNRCIQCYRCTRYYSEYAGGQDFSVLKLRNLVYFGRREEGVLESEFSGNLVEVCPTGVFTDKTLKHHYARKWDLQMAPTVCAHCALGCNVSAGERYGSLRRILNRYNGEVNGYFICDRGRFGYEHVNSDSRIRSSRARQDGQTTELPVAEAIDRLSTYVSAGKAIGIGSPRASLEANFALRSLVGPENFYAGVSGSTHRLLGEMLAVLRQGPAPATLRQIEHSDAALVLGEDITNVAPRMALTLRQTVRQVWIEKAAKLGIPGWQDHAIRELAQKEHGPLFIASPYVTRLDDVATETYHAAPDDIARLGFAVAHILDASSPDPAGLSEAVRAQAQRIAATLSSAERPAVISGVGSGSVAVVRAAADIARALAKAGKPVALAYAMEESNSLGLALMEPKPLDEALDAARRGEAQTVVILENDLYRRAPAATVDALLGSAAHVVALDALDTRTTEKADLVLAAAPFAEADGTRVSSEGRAQRFFRVYPPQEGVQDSWRWLRDAMGLLTRPEGLSWKSLDDVVEAVARAVPALERIRDAAPGAGFRIAGEKIPREPHRYSGRTSMLANINVSEPKPPEDPDSALSFTMEGTPAEPPAALLPFFWTGGWNSIQAVNKFQEEIGGPLRGGDAGVRLISPEAGSASGYLNTIPAAFAPRQGQWLVVARYHIFGSEALSSRAPAIAELSPGPYIALGAEDAASLGVTEGAPLEVTIEGAGARLPLRIEPGLPRGVAALPAGMGPLDGIALPVWGGIEIAK
ncbi:MAG TPA: NADH-quinone oxidoreductase subunit NuoG [Candidatus Dormibacteraeota bacterium]|nr:NADH-quinone oxidoreductase subunit NuoG [Candidatus Dormibacteraeota bacterium]